MDLQLEIGGQKIMKNKRELPFECVIYDSKPEIVQNPLSGDECMLPPDAIAVYDCIKGGELIQDWDLVRKGLDWFIEHEPRAYMILLD